VKVDRQKNCDEEVESISVHVRAIVEAFDLFTKFAEVAGVAHAAAHGILHAAVAVVAAVVQAVFDGAIVP
jgi:hypothetical protein